MSAEGLIYEPRSLWSIGFVDTDGLTDDQPVRVQLNREHFRNGTRYPITVDRVAVCGVAYGYRRSIFTGVPNLLTEYEQWSSVVNKVRISVAVPQRQFYSKNLFSLNALPERKAWMPPTRLVGTGDGTNPSSLYGVTALNFDKPFMLPRTGEIEWQISAWPALNNNDDGIALGNFWQLYEEQGGLTPGSARTRSFVPRRFDQAQLVQTDEGWPYVDNAYTSVGSGSTPDVDTSQWWHPDGNFSGQAFLTQEATRNGSTRVMGIRTFVDQRAFDDMMGNNRDVTPTTTGFPAAMASTFMGSRIRTVNGGSKMYWWRPGAPLALTLDTITPAHVYQLPRPITLSPNDTLDVEMEFPGPSGTLSLDPRYQVGISFNGWSPIEG